MPEIVLTEEGVADTLLGAASFTTPSAGGSICQLVAPPAGKYHVKVSYELSGAAETQLANLKLLANNVTIVTALPTISASGWVTVEFFVTLDGTHNLQLAAIALATTGAVYNAIMAATRVI